MYGQDSAVKNVIDGWTGSMIIKVIPAVSRSWNWRRLHLGPSHILAKAVCLKLLNSDLSRMVVVVVALSCGSCPRSLARSRSLPHLSV